MCKDLNPLIYAGKKCKKNVLGIVFSLRKYIEENAIKLTPNMKSNFLLNHAFDAWKS